MEDKVINIIRESPCVMHFQPIVGSRDNEILGFEALFRGFKNRPVSDFQETLMKDKNSNEQWGFDIDCLVSALHQGKDLAKRRYLFINLQALTIRKFVQNKRAILLFMKTLGIEPRSVVFEISEDTAFDDVPNLTEDVQEIRAAGISVAIDNVKTNFRWLQHLPAITPNYLKIDRLYISDITTSDKRQYFVESVYSMTGELGLDLIAVGVESEAADKVLNGLGVSFRQGFFQGRPQAAETWRKADTGD